MSTAPAAAPLTPKVGFRWIARVGDIEPYVVKRFVQMGSDSVVVTFWCLLDGGVEGKLSELKRSSALFETTVIFLDETGGPHDCWTFSDCVVTTVSLPALTYDESAEGLEVSAVITYKSFALCH